MRRSCVLLLILASACTPMQWQKADMTAEQRQADEQECQQLAWREASVRSWHYYSGLGPVFARDPSGRGYFVWPGTSIVDPYAYQLLDEQRLTQVCMESKGYELVPVPKP